MSEAVLISFVFLLLGIISWFLRMVYKQFEEVKNDVKTLLVKGSARDEDLRGIEADVHTLILRHDTVDKRLQKVEQDIEVIKIKQ